MSFQHAELAAGRWNEFSLMEQLANIGSEVNRALNWRKKNQPDIARNAFERSLELFDLTLDCPANRERLKEICRARECWVDYFFGGNEYGSSDELWKRYFLEFAHAARRAA